MDFLLPPRTQNESGETRKVGFEIEFGGLSLEETAKIIVDLYGGSVDKKHNFAYEIKETRFGTFALESDSRFLSQKRYDTYLQKIGVSSDSVLTDNVEKFLEMLAGTLLPFEVAMPPMPIDSLDEAEKLRQKLFEHSAQGISSSIFAAFGMQFNPEVPDFKAETLLGYLRAFFLLYDWLVEESEVVIARKIAPYIHPFPPEYMDQVLNPNYQPTMNQLIEDYLRMNPTRNRPLDMLPLFTHLNKELVMKYPVERDMIKPRPTFHYRLPNSEVDDPEWSFAKEWNNWVLVEKLAADPSKIERMTKDYLNLHQPNRIFTRVPWINKTREWIDAQA
jgi:hypothetical protein